MLNRKAGIIILLMFFLPLSCAFANSINGSVTVEVAQLNLTAVNISTSNLIIDLGQSIRFTTNVIDGLPPYTYNYIIVNSVTLVPIPNGFNSVSSSSMINVLIFTPYNGLVGNTIEANVIVTDSSRIPSTLNSIYSEVSKINSAPYFLSISPSLTTVQPGETETYVLGTAGGTGPFTVAIYNAANNQQQGQNAIIEPGNYNAITFTPSSPSTATFQYYAVATDLGTSEPYAFNSVTNSVVVLGPSGSGGGGGGGGGSSRPIVTALSNGCLLITNVSVPDSFEMNINGYRLVATDSYIGSNFTGLIIGNSTYNLAQGQKYQINGTTVSLTLLNVSYLPIQHKVALEACSNGASGPSPTPPSGVPQISFTYIPVYATLTSGVTYSSQIGIEDTAAGTESVNLSIGQVPGIVANLSTDYLYINPGQSAATKFNINLLPSITPGTYILPINIKMSMPGGRTLKQTEFVTLEVFNYTAAQPKILNNIALVNYSGTTGEQAMGTIGITSPSNSSIANGTLETIIPSSILGSFPNITVSGLPATIRQSNGTYVIDWHISYLPINNTVYAYYTIKNPMASSQYFRIQNLLGMPSQGPMEISSILRIVNLSVPIFYTNALNHIFVDALYYGAQAGSINFTVIGAKGASVSNQTVTLNATPGEYLTSNFYIKTDGKPGTALLTLYVSANGATTTYTVPIVIVSNPSNTLAYQLHGLSTNYLAYAAIFAAAAVICIAAYSLVRKQRPPKFNYDQFGELKSAKNQIDKD